MKTRKVLAALVVLVAVASAIYFSSNRQSVDGGASMDSNATVGNTAMDANADQKRNASSQTNALERARPLTSLERYAQSNDLFELVAQLRADADAGDVGAARVIAMAYDECYVVAAENPKVVDLYRPSLERFPESERSIYLSIRRRAEQRCVGFIATSGINPADVRSTDAKASAMNDLTAQARQLAAKVDSRRSDDDAPPALSDAEIQTAREIATSGDPEAIASLAYSQDDQQLSKETHLVRPSGNSSNLLAWLLVACDLGRDCGADGYVMRQQCLMLGLCINGDFREYMRRRMLSPDQFEEVLARERAILRAIKSGDVSRIIP